ncbi:hypothetical protein TanjilG_06825 [Lupinus angustifolius]|uniref:RING-type E3 ubiquitin transferase n=1 Tax=Lupinus angustifolius TaxID=3871 RepID=A0A1J7GNG7_LUPAN|nr:PREDICTED: E3 ubiquitin-protein ligase RHF1A-like [Lupinus angustifolius]OIV95849.1 hypothetical protein TanjilG_06825 [Lupinus angustifolius]
MANFTSSSLSHIPPSSSAAFDDDTYEDSCSICLEPFNTNDPPTITCCKHEYHLHCILEWSQRSKECPICSQSLGLEDPASQELLDAVEAEKRLTFRNSHSYPFTSSHDDSSSDDSGFDERIMQHLIAAAESRARFVHRRERQRLSGVGPSEVATNTTPHSDVPFRPRVFYSHTPSESARRLNTSEMFSVPESFKSKFSAASARYKESISKSTRDLKEKLLARNASVKELSKGVQREMNAGIASVTRMIERLDLTSKWSTSPLSPVHTEGTSGLPVKGKSIEENGIGHGPCEESGDLVRDINSDAPSLVSRMVVSRAESPPGVQNGHDAVKT